MKAFSPSDFPNSTTAGEVGFGSLIGSAGVLKLMLTDFGWSGQGAATTLGACGGPFLFLQR